MSDHAQNRRERRSWDVVLVMAALVLSAALAACEGGRTVGEAAEIPTGGDATRGRDLIGHFGCGSCHTIPGVDGAEGVVAPPLTMFARRTFVGGELPNTPENLVRWIQSPKTIEPGTAMPALGINEQQARDIAAYLYTLR